MRRWVCAVSGAELTGTDLAGISGAHCQHHGPLDREQYDKLAREANGEMKTGKINWRQTYGGTPLWAILVHMRWSEPKPTHAEISAALNTLYGIGADAKACQNAYHRWAPQVASGDLELPALRMVPDPQADAAPETEADAAPDAEPDDEAAAEIVMNDDPYGDVDSIADPEDDDSDGAGELVQPRQLHLSAPGVMVQIEAGDGLDWAERASGLYDAVMGIFFILGHSATYSHNVDCACMTVIAQPGAQLRVAGSTVREYVERLYTAATAIGASLGRLGMDHDGPRLENIVCAARYEERQTALRAATEQVPA